MTATSREAYVAGLRRLADTIEGNPDLVLPFTGGESEFSVFTETPAETVVWRRLLRLGCVAEKVTPANAYPIELRGQVEGVTVAIYAKAVA